MGSSMDEAPTANGDTTLIMIAFTWNNGRTSSARSELVKPSAAVSASVIAATFA